MDRPGIAVVGTGYIGVEHIKAIAAHPEAQLQALCATPRSLEDARALGQQYGARRTTDQFAAVVSDEAVDIVYLCTPNSQHVDQAVAALEGGKHVFVEKPLAVTVEQCRRIVAASRRYPGQVMVGHGARFSRIFETVHQLVRDGLLGEACFIEGDYIHDLGPFLDLPGHDWWMDTDNEGQLPIVGGACHPLDLMRWIGGEIIEVSAFGINRNIPRAPWCDTIIANLKFASGALGKCLVSCGAQTPYAMRLNYYGTKGSVVDGKLFIGGIAHVEEAMSLPVDIRPEDHTCAEELAHFIDCIRSGQAPLIDAVEGARSAAVGCAIAQAVESGAAVAVEVDF
ncbi:MAG: hypothetical protein GKR89_19870 [Candidatus Latescibacteria bacterium]|nr:hypothetical protein [Candidatus Latescibacterota bacterium]